MKNKKTKILSCILTLSILLVPLTKSYATSSFEKLGYSTFNKVVSLNKFTYYYLIDEKYCSIYTLMEGETGVRMLSNQVIYHSGRCQASNGITEYQRIEQTFWHAFFQKGGVEFSPLIK